MSSTDAPRPEFRRARALRTALAERILAAPDDAVARGRRNLARLRAADNDGHARMLLDCWERLLDGPVDEIVHALRDPAQDQLASSSPFAGLLSPEERWAVLRSVRTEGDSVAS